MFARFKENQNEIKNESDASKVTLQNFIKNYKNTSVNDDELVMRFKSVPHEFKTTPAHTFNKNYVDTNYKNILSKYEH